MPVAVAVASMRRLAVQRAGGSGPSEIRSHPHTENEMALEQFGIETGQGRAGQSVGN